MIISDEAHGDLMQIQWIASSILENWEWPDFSCPPADNTLNLVDSMEVVLNEAIDIVKREMGGPQSLDVVHCIESALDDANYMGILTDEVRNINARLREQLHEAKDLIEDIERINLDHAPIDPCYAVHGMV